MGASESGGNEEVIASARRIDDVGVECDGSGSPCGHFRFGSRVTVDPAQMRRTFLTRSAMPVVALVLVNCSPVQPTADVLVEDLGAGGDQGSRDVARLDSGMHDGAALDATLRESDVLDVFIPTFEMGT